MSIDLNAPGPSSAPPSEFERTPPQNIEAEQGVLGGMLLSKDAISDVLEVLKPTDFYRPAHQTIYEAALDLYARGDPADAVTVMAELNRRGDLARAGGAPYLHTLVSTVVTAASAGYYAKIVAEQAILRRLVEAGTRIVQLGFAGRGQDVDDIVDRAQQAIFDVTERRASEDYIRLEDLLQPTLHEIESIESRDGIMTGVPTGFIELDKLTNGLHPGNLVILAARPAVGKALALDTPLPTPTGWTTMGEVQVGDFLLGSEGQPTRVVAATEVMHLRACFELTFSDGATIVADAQHQWLTTTHTRRRARALVTVGARAEPFTAAAVVTTVEIAATLRVAGAPNHAIGEGDSEVFVTGARRVPSVPVRCVQVDAADHLFLAGPTKIPTHNSTLGLDIARSAAIKHQLPAVIFSLEMSKLEITMRLLSAEARVHLQSMRTGRMSEEDWGRLARRMGEVANAPLFIDDSPNLTMMEIRAKARRLKQRHDLQLVVVDYMQLMTSPKRVENRQQEVSEISRSMKLLAKELDVPVVAISQLNRSPEQRSDKKPQLSDLRESGSLEQDADVVILLYREDAFERESARAGEADFIVAKHRNGPTNTVTVAFQGHYSRFVDMSPTT